MATSAAMVSARCQPAGSSAWAMPSDVLILTSGLIPTFTAPLSDVALLCYQSPFFELDGAWQFSLPKDIRTPRVAECPTGTEGVCGSDLRQARSTSRLLPARGA